MKKIVCHIGMISFLLFGACADFDPEIPDYSSYNRSGFPEIEIDNYEQIVVTTTSASLGWKINLADTVRIKKLYLCYKDYIPETPAETTDYVVDLLPILKAGQDTIRLTGLHPSTRYHFRPYVETTDSAGYMPYNFINNFTTQKDICQAAWKKITSFPGSSPSYYSTLSFSYAGIGYIGVACDRDYGDKVFDSSLWAYDPSSGEWTRKADFPGSPRWDYVSFSIGSKGYVGLGVVKDRGMFQDLFRDFWEYDAEKDQWRRLSDFPGVYRSEAMSFSVNGKGYVLKGTGWYQDIREMWEYDPNTDSWCERTCIPGDDRVQSAVFTLDGMVYVVGGYDNRGHSLSDHWQYNPVADSWSRKADFPGGGRYDMFALAFDSMAIVGDGSGYKLYNQCMWQYNPSLDSWQEKRNAPVFLHADYANFTLSGKGYVGNGKVLYEYDPLVDID